MSRGPGRPAARTDAAAGPLAADRWPAVTGGGHEKRRSEQALGRHLPARSEHRESQRRDEEGHVRRVGRPSSSDDSTVSASGVWGGLTSPTRDLRLLGLNEAKEAVTQVLDLNEENRSLL